VAQFLTGKKIPSYITDLPQDVIATPFGAMISQFLQNVRVHPTNANGSASTTTTLNLEEDDEDEMPFEGNPDL